MPLLFDYPLEQLKTYKGINPRPVDFDAFWDKGLAEMRALDPKVEIKPAEFQTPYAECSHLFFTGMGNARVHAKLIRPKKMEGKKPAIVMFHGYSGHSGDWVGKLGYAALGCTVAALDCRGQAGLSEDSGNPKGWTLRGHIVRGLDDSPENLYYRNMFLDTAQLTKIVMEMPGVDPARVGAMGGSQGGALTLACAALEPRIKRAAPVYPFLSDYKRVWDLDLAANAYAEIQDYFRNFDPRHERENEIFTKLGYVDIQFLCPRIKGEVLMGIGFQDRICPPSSQFAAYNKITAKKSYVAYPDFGHENLPDFGEKTFDFMMGL
ncbi:MAG: alpha/beta fold hydrolase [Fibrobacterota bacterium]